MSDDPGWGGGLTPPVPKKPVGTGSSGPNKLLIGAAIVVVIAVLVVVLALNGSTNPNHSAGKKTTTTALSTATTSHSSGSATTSPTPSTSSTTSSSTIPFIGVQVSATGNPVNGPNGQQISITDASNNSIPLTGVTVQAVSPTAKVRGKTVPSSAAVAGIATGDEIWAIGEIQSSKFTEVTDGAILSTFLRNYAVTGHTDDVYLYYYDPATNTDMNTNPPEVPLAEVSGSITSIDCTATGGC